MIRNTISFTFLRAADNHLHITAVGMEREETHMLLIDPPALFTPAAPASRRSDESSAR